MKEALKAGLFAGYVLAALLVIWRSRSTPEAHRRAVTLFLAYALAAGFGAGLLQRDFWPFTNWPLVAGIHGPVANHARIMAVDRSGHDHRVDYRAWQPFVSDELIAWVNGRFLELPPADRDRAADYLVGLAARGAEKAARGEPIGYFDRFWGPLAAPYFLLHPKWWASPADVPAEPLVGLRLYHDTWNLQERRANPGAVERSIQYQVPAPMMSSVASRVAGAWDAFWFQPASALNLAAARVIICAHAIWLLGSRDLAAMSGVPAVFWSAVPARDLWRYLVFPGHEGLEQALQAVAFAALAAGLLGLWPRLACFCAGLLLYHLAPLEALFWTPNVFERGFTITTMALIALSCSPCGDALCLWPRRRAPAPLSPEYRWPLVLVQLQVCLPYFVAGYSKIYRAGLAWAGAGNLRDWLTVFSQQDQITVVSWLGLWLADRPWASGLIGISALALDLGLITMVFWPRLRPWLIPTALFFHLGILLTMGIFFLNVPQLLVFVNWAAVAARVQARRPEPST